MNTKQSTFKLHPSMVASGEFWAKSRGFLKLIHHKLLALWSTKLEDLSNEGRSIDMSQLQHQNHFSQFFFSSWRAWATKAQNKIKRWSGKSIIMLLCFLVSFYNFAIGLALKTCKLLRWKENQQLSMASSMHKFVAALLHVNRTSGYKWGYSSP